MKKHIILLGFFLSLCLYACSPANAGETTIAESQTEIRIETGTADAETAVHPTIPESSVAEDTDSRPENTSPAIRREANANIPEELYEYRSVSVFHKDKEWSVSIFTSAVPEADGFFAFDDSNHFRITAEDSNGQFLLFDDRVQLGIPAMDIYEDTESVLHVVIRDFRTAQYKITDYRYNDTEDVFVPVTIIDQSGINFFGSY